MAEQDALIKAQLFQIDPIRAQEGADAFDKYWELEAFMKKVHIRVFVMLIIWTIVSIIIIPKRDLTLFPVFLITGFAIISYQAYHLKKTLDQGKVYSDIYDPVKWPGARIQSSR